MRRVGSNREMNQAICDTDRQNNAPLAAGRPGKGKQQKNERPDRSEQRKAGFLAKIQIKKISDRVRDAGQGQQQGKQQKRQPQPQHGFQFAAQRVDRRK